MFLKCTGKHNQIIKENKNFLWINVPHALFHEPLESAWCICYSLGHTIKLIKAEGAHKGCFGLVWLIHFDLMIARLEVHD